MTRNSPFSRSLNTYLINQLREARAITSRSQRALAEGYVRPSIRTRTRTRIPYALRDWSQEYAEENVRENLSRLNEFREQKAAEKYIRRAPRTTEIPRVSQLPQQPPLTPPLSPPPPPAAPPLPPPAAPQPGSVAAQAPTVAAATQAAASRSPFLGSFRSTAAGFFQDLYAEGVEGAAESRFIRDPVGKAAQELDAFVKELGPPQKAIDTAKSFLPDTIAKANLDPTTGLPNNKNSSEYKNFLRKLKAEYATRQKAYGLKNTTDTKKWGLDTTLKRLDQLELVHRDKILDDKIEEVSTKYAKEVDTRKYKRFSTQTQRQINNATKSGQAAVDPSKLSPKDYIRRALVGRDTPLDADRAAAYQELGVRPTRFGKPLPPAIGRTPVQAAVRANVSGVQKAVGVAAAAAKKVPGGAWLARTPWAAYGLVGLAPLIVGPALDFVGDTLSDTGGVDLSGALRNREAQREALFAQQRRQLVQQKLASNMLRIQQLMPHKYLELLAGEPLEKGAFLLGPPPRPDLVEQLAVDLTRGTLTPPNNPLNFMAMKQRPQLGATVGGGGMFGGGGMGGMAGGMGGGMGGGGMF